MDLLALKAVFFGSWYYRQGLAFLEQGTHLGVILKGLGSVKLILQSQLEVNLKQFSLITEEALRAEISLWECYTPSWPICGSRWTSQKLWIAL